MYDNLLSDLPRQTSYVELIPHLPYLQPALFDIYTEYVRIGLRTVKTFGRGNNWLKRMAWKRDQKAHEDTLQRLRRTKDRVEVELRHFSVANITDGNRAPIRAQTPSIASPTTPDTILSAPKALTATHFSVPFPQNKTYCGQEGLLIRIHECLRPSATETQYTLRFFVLCGLGGSGKSQVALEYVHRYRDSFEACFWITCDTSVKITQGFVEIARKLQLDVHGHSQAHHVVRDWFCENGRNCLLILDNAESPVALEEYLPPTTQGSLLLTSQDQTWLIQEFITKGERLGPFSKADGVRLLRLLLQRVDMNISDEDAGDIVDEMGALPLAVRQVGSYLTTTSIDPATFLADYRDIKMGAALNSLEQGLISYPHTLATVWKLSFDRLSPASLHLLSIISFLDPDRIPKSAFDINILRWVYPDSFQTQHHVLRALGEISRYSLIVLDPPGQDISVHRLVQQYCLDRLTVSERQRSSDIAIRLLRHVFPRQSPFAEPLSEEWPECERWITHVTSLSNRLAQLDAQILSIEQVAELFLDASIYLWERGLLSSGERLIIIAKRICEDQNTKTFKNNALVSDIDAFQATFLAEQGDLSGAFECFERQAHDRRSNLTSIRDRGDCPTMVDDIQLSNAYNNLAGICLSMGKLAAAEMWNILSLQIKEYWHTQVKVNDHVKLDYLLSLSYSNTANLYGRQRRWEEGAEYYNRSLEASKNSKDLLKRALTFHNYGCMRWEEGKIPVALELFSEAFQLRKGKLGDHFDTANTLHMIACCQSRLDDQLAARDCLLEAIRILEGLAHPDKRRIARSKYKLSLVLHHLKDPAEMEFRRDALDIYQAEQPSHDHSITLDETAFDNLVAHI
ncbi:hypothetical protein N7451_010682 [Penicillium sp. IBT 35674x]|nr:hypothetical protein N7451_010682 [Penicillium sp. IBT 35674x]